VKALAKQFDSQVVTLSGPKGATVSATHATFAGELERFSCWRLGVLRVYSRSAASRNQTSLALSALGTFLRRQSAKSSTATFSM
jgi:hypothetical protein